MCSYTADSKLTERQLDMKKKLEILCLYCNNLRYTKSRMAQRYVDIYNIASVSTLSSLRSFFPLPVRPPSVSVAESSLYDDNNERDGFKRKRKRMERRTFISCRLVSFLFTYFLFKVYIYFSVFSLNFSLFTLP